MKRTKRRYIALQLDCEGVPSDRELMDAIWGAVTRLYGEVGASLTGLALIDFDIERKIVVIRTSLVSLLSMRSSLASVTNVAGGVASLNVLAVSGTLKALSASLRSV